MSSQCCCHLSSINLKQFLWLFFICPSFTLIKTWGFDVFVDTLSAVWIRRPCGSAGGKARCPGGAGKWESSKNQRVRRWWSRCAFMGPQGFLLSFYFALFFLWKEGVRDRNEPLTWQYCFRLAKFIMCKMPALRHDSIILKVFTNLVQYLWAFQ